MSEPTPNGVAAREPSRDAPDERFVILSDLHLTESGFGEPTGDPVSPNASEAFAALVEHMRSRTADGTRTRLVLLGDTLELVDPRLSRFGARIPPVGSRLRAIAEANPSVFRALRSAIEGGLELDVVPGNHDAELAFPSVQACFREVVAPGAGDTTDAIIFHPWIYYVPGVLYAEHGHQYHDVNAFASPLEPSLADDPEDLDHPIGAYVDASLRDARTARRTRPMRAPAADGILLAATVVRGLVRYGTSAVAFRNARRRRREERRAILDRYADAIALARPSLRAIDALSRRGVLAVGSRVATYGLEWLRRSIPLGGRSGLRTSTGYRPEYLYAAAAAIDEILCRRGEEVPMYVFGHSHVVERVAVRTRAGAADLLGTGTWTSQGPGRADLPSRTGRFPWIEIERRADRISSRVCLWDAEFAREEVLA